MADRDVVKPVRARAAFLSALTLAACATLPTSAPLRYPETPRSDVVDDYFGVPVADPYRWLEDADAPATRAWVDAQNRLSRPLLAALPERPAIRERLAALWSYERYSVPQRTPAGTLVYELHDGRRDQPVLYAAEASGAPRVLLDPNTWSADATEALMDWRVSPDGRHLAYAVSSGGTDWVEYRVLDLAAGTVLPDRVRGVNFNFDFSRIFWRGGNAGFFYSRFPEPPADAPAGAPPQITHQQLYWHALGTPQERDVPVYARPDQPTWFVWGEATDDGRYLVIYVEQEEDGAKQVLVKDLRDPSRPRLDAPTRTIVGDWRGKYYLVGSRGPLLYFRTSAGAGRYRIVACDLRRRGAAAWREVVPESADVLLDAKLLGGELVAVYLRDAASRLSRFTLDGRALGDLALPGLGTARKLSGAADSPVIYYGFSSFSQPETVYRFDLRAGRGEPLHAPRLQFDPADYVTERHFYASRDGTRVPLFITHRRDVRPDASTPALLYGYGGFASAQTPSFTVPHLVWMERGGVFAQASIRGGSEYGDAWHRGGMLARKQNGFDDFIAAAEYLVARGFTSPAHLAIKGRSNGGLLVGAVTNQRPELFAAAAPAVGVMDMLRYHRFGIAYAWAGDYGRSDDPAMFPVLRAYSPVHNVRAGVRYPAVIATTADHDDRVHPLHSFKYVAALQAAQAGDRPILIRIETRAGHGSGGVGTPLTKHIEENADVLAFLAHYTR